MFAGYFPGNVWFQETPYPPRERSVKIPSGLRGGGGGGDGLKDFIIKRNAHEQKLKCNH